MLVIINGDVGTGKTLFMVLIANSVKNNTFFANFDISKIKKDYIHFDKDLLMRTDFQDAEVFIDEISQYIDPRTSMSNENVLMSYLYLQSRKRNLNIYGTLQSTILIDKRYKEKFDMLVECRLNSDLDFTYSIYKNTKTGRLRKLGKFILERRNAQYYYKLYDTKEVVLSDNTMKKIRNSLSFERQDEIADEYIDKFPNFREKFANQNLTKNLCKFFCQRYDLPTTDYFINRIYITAKEKEAIKKRESKKK